ncbi:HD domain-containing protein [Prevotella sp. OH937_COT-195]|uniref:HD domain-containing protein n=1 Tax=Prevotella sp. OH937_COT-195 TaxID=2491051 RepID=UPI000F6518A3|nr:HD domain-containing protein [Prevotella sp. OH937_COT-195]RRD02400.1 HD domain-containing protein [Prevotella sp. OH937_COT-195]
MNDSKIINDPVFGFIKIPRGIILSIVQHPLMQRLTRIRQLGLTNAVYPAAQHTRFQHSIGAFHLMSEAVTSLKQKGISISDSEAEAIGAAILMHDIGHGPFSHVLENALISGISHEEISIMMMERMNEEMNGELNLTLKIFKDDHPKHFLHQLISSQLDMDRLDYLRRDSFFTGVNEGSIGSARIIKMLNVVDDQLVVDSKGIYSLENYLTSRRLMYWQVYLHKTAVACEKVLVNTLLRAKHLAMNGKEVFAPPCLKYFLTNDIDGEMFRNSPEALCNYILLDDNDIWSAIKVWTYSDDKILSLLATDMLNRNIFKVEVSNEPASEERMESLRKQIAKAYGIEIKDTSYLVSLNAIQKDMYDVNEDRIAILYKDGTVKDISESSEILNVELLSKKIRKYYLCYQRF